jgi:hypothetical protein
MEIQEIKETITELAQKYQLSDEDAIGFEMVYLYEQEAEDLIIGYCEQKRYLIEGFPTEKRKTIPLELQDDYFCKERFQFYLDKLSLQKHEIAVLTYHYQKSFWPDSIGTFEEFIEMLQFQMDSSNFYDVNQF